MSATPTIFIRKINRRSASGWPPQHSRRSTAIRSSRPVRGTSRTGLRAIPCGSNSIMRRTVCAPKGRSKGLPWRVPTRNSTGPKRSLTGQRCWSKAAHRWRSGMRGQTTPLATFIILSAYRLRHSGRIWSEGGSGVSDDYWISYGQARRTVPLNGLHVPALCNYELSSRLARLADGVVDAAYQAPSTVTGGLRVIQPQAVRDGRRTIKDLRSSARRGQRPTPNKQNGIVRHGRNYILLRPGRTRQIHLGDPENAQHRKDQGYRADFGGAFVPGFGVGNEPRNSQCFLRPCTRLSVSITSLEMPVSI